METIKPVGGFGVRYCHEDMFHHFLNTNEPCAKLDCSNFKGLSQCLWSLKQAIMNYGLDKRLTAVQRSNVGYLVNTKYLEEFNLLYPKASSIGGPKKNATIPNEPVQASVEPSTQEQPLAAKTTKKLFLPIIKGLKEIYDVTIKNGFNANFISDLIVSQVNSFNDECDLLNFEDFSTCYLVNDKQEKNLCSLIHVAIQEKLTSLA